MHDLGVWFLLITLAGTHLFPCCNVTFSTIVESWKLFTTVFIIVNSLSAFFFESVPGLLGLHMSLEGLHVLVKMFSICDP